MHLWHIDDSCTVIQKVYVVAITIKEVTQQNDNEAGIATKL